ncbi:MAG: phosphatidate cytidylyltransferase [Magnetococcales bacterium]|nr:phosphatidate cytidylyltransferase [Magnetococcales bacterium]
MLTRILSTIVLVPLVLLLLLKGEPLHYLLVLIPLSAGLLYEWHGLFKPIAPLRYILSVAAGVLILLQGYGFAFPLVLIPFGWFFLLFLQELASGRAVDHDGLSGMLVHFFGVLYIALPLSMLLMVAQVAQGSDWIIYIFSILWSTDSGAYFVGKAIGKHKFSPRVSPNKTWEGTLGGLFMAALIGTGVAVFLELPMPLWHAVTLSMIASSFGQIGDLAESYIKRVVKIKDSGNLIPGHGGLLDRLDSLLFAAPIIYFYTGVILGQ